MYYCNTIIKPDFLTFWTITIFNLGVGNFNVFFLIGLDKNLFIILKLSSCQVCLLPSANVVPKFFLNVVRDTRYFNILNFYCLHKHYHILRPCLNKYFYNNGK